MYRWIAAVEHHYRVSIEHRLGHCAICFLSIKSFSYHHIRFSMPSRIHSLLALFAAVAVATSNAQISQVRDLEAEADAEQATGTLASYQTAMLAAVNAERAKQGLSALCMNSKLTTAAQAHSADMASNNYMSHTGSDGSTASARLTSAGFKWASMAENVAAGQTNVTNVMAAWMNSAGHKANILGSYKFFGMGYAYSASSTYKYYWTQDFGTGSSESCSTTTTTNSASQTTQTTATPKATTATPKATTATPKTTTATPSTTTSTTLASYQKAMLAAVNAERAKQGLSALCTNTKLTAAAQAHSADMAKNNYMSHTGSGGSTMSERVTDAGFDWNSVAENVAAGQASVSAVMTAWMNSAGHKANILGNYKFFGMGYAYSSSSTYGYYWTQDFGTGSTESCA